MDLAKLKGPWKPEHVFAVLALFFGLLFVFATPPTQAPDETWHFYRSFMTSELNFALDPSEPGGMYSPTEQRVVHSGAVLPVSLNRLNHHDVMELRDVRPLWSVPLDSGNRAFIPFVRTCPYPFVPYAPQAVGVALGRLLHLPLLGVFSLGRLSNLVFWVLMVSLAIRLTPILKWALALLALMPLMVFQTASCGTDPVVCGLSFLTCAAALHYAYGASGTLTRRDWALLLLLGVLLGLAKPVYFPLVLLFLIVPAERFGGWRRALLFHVSLVVLGVAAILIWSQMTKSLVPEDLARKSRAQFDYILSHPVQFVLAFLRSWKYNPSPARLFGRLGWLDVKLPAILVYTNLVLVLAAALTDKGRDVVIRLREKGICLLSVTPILAMIGAVFYMTATPLGHSMIYAMTDSGRYYLPILFPLLLLFRRTGPETRAVLALGAFVCLAWALYLVVQWY